MGFVGFAQCPRHSAKLRIRSGKSTRQKVRRQRKGLGKIKIWKNLKKIGKKPLANAPPSPSKSTTFFVQIWQIHGRWDSNMWPSPHGLNSLYNYTTASYMSRFVLVSHILYSIECKLFVWDPKWIQIKKLSTIIFYRLLRFTTFILIVSPSEVVYKI